MDNLTIVVPFWNGHATIERLLDSLPTGLPVIIVDDQSDKPLTLKRKGVTVIRPEARGYFAGACNTGMNACKTDVLILNQDVWFTNNAWVDLIEKYRANHAVIGDGVFGHPAWTKGYVQGTFMYMRRDAINQVGTFNAADYPLWGCTAEWQVRAARKGFKPYPLSPIPGMGHERRGKAQFGEAITETLKRQPSDKAKFIRTPPAVSVIVPCFNYGRFLPDLIASLIGGKSSLGNLTGQTFQSFELIIVDDASTDDTMQIVQKLSNPWMAIRSIRLIKNSGTAAAINAGIEKAFGKYITILGADDMMEPWRLESLYRAAEANPHSMIYDDVMIFRDGNRVQEWIMSEYDFETLIYKNQVHAGIMFPRTAWKEVGGYPAVFKDGREDWAFNVALGTHGYCGIHVKRPGYLYRREKHNRSLTNNNKRELFLSRLQATFPNIYRGERPTMCCGQKTSPGAKPVSKLAKIATTLPGAAGMTELEYIGKSIGKQTWYGAVTGTRYVFGMNKPYAWVDNKDVRTGNGRKPGLLEIIENGKPAFRLRPAPPPPPAPVPAPVPVSTVPKPEPEPEPVVEQVVIVTSDGIDEQEASKAAKVLAEYEPIKGKTRVSKRSKKA